MSLSLGVDVGGTNSDAAVLRGNVVVASAKTVTSANVTDGVRAAVAAVLMKLTAADRAAVGRVCVGTTHFLNAVVQKRRLARVSVLRLCGRASRALPPFADVTPKLRAAVEHEVFLVDGGYSVDGKEMEKVNRAEIEAAAAKIKAAGGSHVVVSGIFSPTNPSQEEAAAEILKESLPGVSLTLSHKIGHMGLLERENAAILNECLKRLCRWTLQGFETAFKDLGMDCPIYLTQNDGTLDCLEYPVRTFASGSTNSMRGAAFLAKGSHDESLSNALVADIGGTTTDIGQLVNGFPRQAAAKVEIGGVYTNFRMPELYSLGLGGGSLVDLEKCTVGPLSVGRDLLERSQCVGGSDLTASDVAVRAGLLCGLGSADRVKLDAARADEFVEVIRAMVEDAVDRVKVSPEPVPLLVVGGGGVLLNRDVKMEGVSKVVFPEHYDVANAVGAALAQISGTFDQVIVGVERSKAVETAKTSAIEAAVAAGAKRDTVEIVELVETPIAYIPGFKYSKRSF